MTAAANGSGGRIAGLDGLRAISVLAVVWHHSHAPIPGLPISGNGFLGVDVFFVLSGFLISMLLLQERHATGAISLRNFYARRTLRIFPLYYAVIVVLGCYLLWKGSAEGREQFLEGLPFLATYTSNWVHVGGPMAITWSLSTEEQFYLLWPPLLALLGRRSVVLLLFLLGVSEAVNFGLADAWLARVGMPYESREILQCTFTPIILGVMLAFLLEDSANRATLRRICAWPVLMLIIAALLLVANTADLRGAPRLAFHILTAVLLGGIAVRQESPVTRALEWRPLAYIGVISYGIYLLHMIGLDVGRRIVDKAGLPVAPMLFPFGLAVTIMIAAASYRYFESPLLALRSRFRKRSSPGTLLRDEQPPPATTS